MIAKVCATCEKTFHVHPSRAAHRPCRFCSTRCDPQGRKLFDDVFLAGFWNSIAVGDPDRCWPWKRSINSHGYGHLSVMGTEFMSHRCAWVLSNGCMGAEDCVLHRCDNRRCCNPAHLFLGSKADNSEDMVSKGRSLCGERNKASKLTTHNVTEIRNSDEPYAQLSRKFGVSEHHIYKIKSGLRWSFDAKPEAKEIAK